MKRRSNAQKNANWARAYGSAERVEWVGLRPCVFCHRVGTEERPNQNAHVKNGGTSRKADARWIVPACHGCHGDAHQGLKTNVLSKDELYELAEWTESLWQHHLQQREHLAGVNLR